MSHGDTGLAPGGDPPNLVGPLDLAERALAALNRWIVRIGAVGLLAASFILTYSVITRFLFKMATDWQDEAAVFCIVGAVFTASAYVQAYRGHIGIELLAHFLPPGANRIRAILVDVASLAFCSFFAWKSWTLWLEAYREKWTTTSAWSPPLWIPYLLMALGVTLLAVQIALQVVTAVRKRR